MTDPIFDQAQRQWEEELEPDAGSDVCEDCRQRKCKCPELDEI